MTVCPIRRITMPRPLLAAIAALVLALPAAAADVPDEAAALAERMHGARVVLLGEVHDNGPQHALRAAALERLIASGERPALAFEQFDRDAQATIDRARREHPGDVDYLIAQAKGRGGWNWPFYRPMLALALAHDLPIVAANLSRGDAMRVATEGYGAVFDERAQRELGLDALPAPFLREHERAVEEGHCGRLPEQVVAPMARAQIARDIVLAQSLVPYVSRGVVLLTGNGHVRRDVGVPFWLERIAKQPSLSIGLLEADDGGAGGAGAASSPFDGVFRTPPVQRADPCEQIRSHRAPPAEQRALPPGHPPIPAPGERPPPASIRASADVAPLRLAGGSR